jgi:hypothetical protein
VPGLGLGRPGRVAAAAAVAAEAVCFPLARGLEHFGAAT